MRHAAKTFALCIDNAGNQASLIVGKLYRIIPDARAARDGMIRVVDEDAEDYLYPESRFILLRIPFSAARRLRARERAAPAGR
jgi:hypothetical protein